MPNRYLDQSLSFKDRMTMTTLVAKVLELSKRLRLLDLTLLSARPGAIAILLTERLDLLVALKPFTDFLAIDQARELHYEQMAFTSWYHDNKAALEEATLLTYKTAAN